MAGDPVISEGAEKGRFSVNIKGNWAGNLIRYAIGIALVAGLLYYLDWSEAVKLFTLISWQQLLSLFLLQLLTLLLAVAIWCLLFSASGVNSSPSEVFQIHLAGIFVDNVTPGAKFGGEGARLYWFKQHTGAAYGQLAMLMIIQKIITLLPLVLLCILGMKWLMTVNPGHKYLLMAKLSLGLFVGIIFLIILIFFLACKAHFKRSKITCPAGLAGRTSILPAKWRQRLEIFKRQARPVLKVLREDSFKKKLWLAVTIALILWGLYAVKFLMIASIVQFEVGFWSLAKASLLAYLIGMLPVTPGGLGVFEVTLTSFLMLLGGTPQQIGAMLLFYRLLTYVLPTFFGGIAFLVLIVKKNRNKKGTTNIVPGKGGC